MHKDEQGYTSSAQASERALVGAFRQAETRDEPSP